MCCSPPEDITVRVQYAGLMLQLTNCTEEEIDIPAGSTFPELISVLASRHGAKLRAEVYDPERARLRPGIVALVNGSPPTPQTWLRAGDEVSFMVALAGG